MKKANKIITILMFVFLYIPMAVLIVGSFNTGKSLSRFDGFTFEHYAELFRDGDLLKLLGNSLIISVLASFSATVFGTLSAIGTRSGWRITPMEITRWSRRPLKSSCGTGRSWIWRACC